MNIIYPAKLSYLKLKHFLLIVYSNLQYKNDDADKKKKYLNYVKKIEKRGYCIIQNYFSAKECKKIKKNINFYINKNSNKIYIDKEKSDYRLFGLNYFNDQYISKFSNDYKILTIVENYMKLKIENAFVMAGKLFFKNKNLGSGGGWHRDGINRNIKAMVYLTNVTKRNGPLQILEKSNNFKNILDDHKLINKINFTDTRFSNEEINKIINKKKNKIITITEKAGTLIIFDGSYIHRGKPIQKGFRYALTNYYSPKKRVERERNAVKEYLLTKN